MNAWVVRFFGLILLAVVPAAVSVAGSVNPDHLYKVCMPELTKRFTELHVEDADTVHKAAHYACNYFAEKCRTEPEGEACQKAIREFVDR